MVVVMENQTVFVAFILTAVAFVGLGQSAIPPDDVRFAELRCRESLTGVTAPLAAQWVNGHYPNDPVTHCFVHCLLYSVGLIDLHTRSLDLTKAVDEPSVKDDDSYFDCVNGIYENEIEKDNSTQELDGRCVSSYNKLMEVLIDCPRFFELVLPKTDNKDQEHLYKALNVTAKDYCWKLLNSPSESSKELGSETRESCELACVFQRFHYFDSYGRLNEDEIVRSFREAHADSFKNVQSAKTCTHRANSFYVGDNPCTMATALEECLKRVSGDYSHVYGVRNAATRNY